MSLNKVNERPVMSIPFIEDDEEIQELELSTPSMTPAISLAGLDMDKFIHIIRYDNSFVSGFWTIADEFGTIYHWYMQQNQQRFRKISNMREHRNHLLRTETSDNLWDRFKLSMYQNRFILITTIGPDGRAMLYYCHRNVARISSGQSIILFGKVKICNQPFVDSLTESTFEVEPMRHILLHGRCFKIRIQSNSHKIFIRSDDIIHDQIEFQWIQQLPTTITTVDDREERIIADDDRIV